MLWLASRNADVDALIKVVPDSSWSAYFIFSYTWHESWHNTILCTSFELVCMLSATVNKANFPSSRVKLKVWSYPQVSWSAAIAIQQILWVPWIHDGSDALLCSCREHNFFLLAHRLVAWFSVLCFLGTRLYNGSERVIEWTVILRWSSLAIC